MFKKVLIANRGEIAVRIAATLQQMGVTAAAVFSDVDRNALHVGLADEAYPLEGKAASETYLRGDKLIDIAKRHGVDAIHPGYGFLAENADFAQACGDAGLVFVGPKPEVIRTLGDKIRAKEILAKAGVPVVPGWSGKENEGAERFATEAEKIGYPILLKAAAGGGGKGMRVVGSARELPAGLEACRREATAAFGDSRVFIEKYIARPRHIEFQIFGDEHGHIVHMYERECSIQRRHQKIVEETPSPGLTPALRQKMGDAAVAAARAVGYSNAGTVEFLVDDSGEFYFLEVNTRLQVEHPVTEMTLRLDLVHLQLRVAAGEELPFTQEQLRPQGHAIECRIYAEDAARGFLPSTGTIAEFALPTAPNLRVDSGVCASSEVSVYYDPMLAKMISWGVTREDSLRRLVWALQRSVVLGVTTNIEFLQALICGSEFGSGRLHTHFLEEHPVSLSNSAPVPDDIFIAAALAMHTSPQVNRNSPLNRETYSGNADSLWRAAVAWRGA